MGSTAGIANSARLPDRRDGKPSQPHLDRVPNGGTRDGGTVPGTLARPWQPAAVLAGVPIHAHQRAKGFEDCPDRAGPDVAKIDADKG